VVQHTRSARPRLPDAGPEATRPDQSRRPAPTPEAPPSEKEPGWIDVRFADLSDPRLNPTEKLLLMALRLWDWQDPAGVDRFHPSNAHISQAIGIKKRQVQYILDELVSKGFLEIHKAEWSRKNPTHRAIFRRAPAPSLSIAPMHQSAPPPCSPVHPSHAVQCTPPHAPECTQFKTLPLDGTSDVTVRPPDGGNDNDSIPSNGNVSDASGSAKPSPKTIPTPTALVDRIATRGAAAEPPAEVERRAVESQARQIAALQAKAAAEGKPPPQKPAPPEPPPEIPEAPPPADREEQMRKIEAGVLAWLPELANPGAMRSVPIGDRERVAKEYASVTESFAGGFTAGHRGFMTSLSAARFGVFAGMNPGFQARLMRPHRAGIDSIIFRDQVRKLDPYESLPAPPPRPQTTRALIASLRGAPADWPNKAAESIVQDLGTKDRKFFPGFLALCTAVWSGAFPADQVVDAWDQAMCPKVKNKGAMFNKSVQRNGWRWS
jgi:hypothetical protein